MEIPEKLIDCINTVRAPLPPVSDPEERLHIGSLALVRIVSFMEIDCDIRLEDEELIAENFLTLHTLEKLIENKSQSAQTSSMGS